ncbi:MAG: DUF2079 domain-containing protein [Verrucomicrobiia bacterium]|jgi:uncharacterized membrane protein
MPTASRVPAGAFRHLVFLVVMALGVLAAFGVLLGQRFSPENYQVVPTVPDTVELTAFGAAVVAAVCAFVVLTRKRDSWSRLAKGALPVAGASVLVLVKQLWNVPIHLYDMLLFCLACGWTTRSWMQGLPASDSRAGETFTEHRLTKPLRVVVWGSVVALAVYQFRHQVWYLNNLALGYADCGENARLLFNSITNPHELFLRVNPDKPLCYDHIDFGIVPFLPLWLLWPDLKLTILLQVISVFGVAVPLFFTAKRALQSETAALMVVLAWVLYPSTSQFVYSASYGFRWGNMCLLLYFAALVFWSNGRMGWALVCAVWAILIKEEAAIVVGMFGVYLVLFERRKLAGTVLATSAFGYFLLATSVLVPLISGHHYAMTSFFRDLGNSKLEILLSPVTRPAVFWGNLFEPASWYFAALLLAPLLFLPLRKPSILCVGLLTFVFCCMNHILKNICFHYQAGLLPVIFWAFVVAIQQQPGAQQRFATLTGVAVSCAAVSLFLGAQPWSKSTATIHLSPGRLGLVERVRSAINPNGSLFATQRVAAHFVKQRYLYLDLPVPDSIDDALLDLRDSWRGSTEDLLWLERLRHIQHEVEANPNLHLISADDGLLFYSRQGSPLDPQTFVERDALPPTANHQKLELGSGVSVVGFTLEPMEPVASLQMDQVRVTGFFTVSARTNGDIAVRCIANLNDLGNVDSYASEYQPLGQCVWPVSKWETNKYYIESFRVLLPTGLARSISSVNFTAMPLDQSP